MILRDATPTQLEQAAKYNHIELFSANAFSEGGETKTTEGLIWTYSGPDKSSNISFPSLTEANAAEKLDELMNWYRAHPPKNAGCWSLDPSQPADLGIRLLARGFQPGWCPCWMSLDLEKINTDHPVPAGLEVKADNHTDTSDMEQLPYAGNNGAVSPVIVQTDPEHTQRFIATMNGEVVGQSCVFLTTGEYGVAGLYNVGVIPKDRNKGIGKALVLAACLYAKEKGYRYSILNATYDGKRIYTQVGFQWINDGLTWWLMSKKYITDPPLSKQVALAEAIGTGDKAALDKFANQFTATDLDTPITNGMTLMQLATHCKQPASAEWLLAQGATYSILDAWDMGWKDRAKNLLQENPALINQLYDEYQGTLLHVAAARNDVELAKLALTANPDFTIRDKTYDGTALGWAEYLNAKEVAELIRKNVNQ